MVWQPLADLVRRNSDTYRPLRLAQVLDTSEWAASGPSFVQVLVNGDSRRAIYRDGPQPAIGSFLQAIQTGPDTAAPYLAFPLPQVLGCPGMLYASVKARSTGIWYIVRCDYTVGGVWQVVATSPVQGYDRQPLWQEQGAYLYTWGSSLDWATPGPLYRSTDHGATWAACGIDIVNFANQQKYGGLFACGGTAVCYSPDKGASWQTLEAPGGTVYSVALYTGSGEFQVVALTSDGAYYFANYGWDWPTAGGWASPLWSSGPWTPGGRGNIDGGNNTGEYILLGTGDDYHFSGAGGGSGASTYLATITYLFAPGAMTFWRYHGGYYGPSDHPLGLGTVLILAEETGPSNTPAQWPIVTVGILPPFCEFVALDDATTDNPRLLSRQIDTDYNYTAWAAADARMATDLGDTFDFSADGLAVMYWYEYNYGWLGGATDATDVPR